MRQYPHIGVVILGRAQRDAGIWLRLNTALPQSLFQAQPDVRVKPEHDDVDGFIVRELTEVA